MAHLPPFLSRQEAEDAIRESTDAVGEPVLARTTPSPVEGLDDESPSTLGK